MSDEDKQMSCYRNEVLSMEDIFNIEEQCFFPTWLNKFEYAVNMIEVPENKMTELFISMLHDDVHQPVKNDNKFDIIIKSSYDQILHHYSYLFLDSEEFEFHRCRFNFRDQYALESIPQYANNLRKIYIKCNYETDKEMKLCRRFLNGINDNDIRKYLRKNLDLSFNEYVERAVEFAKVNNITHYLNQIRSIVHIYKRKKKDMFYIWLNKFEFVANIIEVPHNRMSELFKNMVHNVVQQDIIKFYSHIELSQLSYDELVTCYLRYFLPLCDTDLHKRRFMCRKQYEHETIQKYAENLRKIYNKCNVTDLSEKILCKQFLGGIHENNIKTQINVTLCQSFDEIIEKVLAFLKDNETNFYLEKTRCMIEIFKPDEDKSFFTWLTQFEAIAYLHNIPYERMGELLFTMLHENVQKFIMNNSEAFDYLELSYDQILDKCRYLFFGTEKFNLYETYFAKRKQFAGEPTKKYAESLGKLYSNCDYKNYRDRKLSKQLVYGLRSEKEKKYFSHLPFASFAEIVTKAVEYEIPKDVPDYVNSSTPIITVFNPEKKERFYEWFNKFEYVTDRAGVPDDQISVFFNAMVNNDAHKSVKQRFSSVNFLELTYKQLTDYYLRYYAFSYESDLHKKRFMCRVQYDNETIQNYANNLKKIFNMCNFTDYPIEKLIERFIDGIHDDDIRFHLSRSHYISFTDIVAKAIEFEKANDITHYLNSALSMINIYNPKKEGKFYEWLNKFEFVADFVEVPDNLRVRFFNKMIEYDIYTGVKQTFPCVRLSALSYKEIIELYLRYFSYSCETHFNKLRFLCRIQYKNETIDKYANSLCDLYDKFNNKSQMNQELCKQFLLGIRDYDMRTHLKQTPHLSFYETVEKAIAFEQGNEISNFLYKAITKINIYESTKSGMFFEWVNKFEYVADMIGLPDKKLNIFFDKMVSNGVHTGVKKANPFVEFSKLSYEEKIILYLCYFSPIDKREVHRRRFTSRKQYEDETIKKFASHLQKIHDKCNYKLKSVQKLREQFLSGLRNKYIVTQLMLNTSSRIPFTKLVEKAIGFEKGTHILQSKRE
ncbi:hypothetical protein M0804_013382 [Polistes exclamans]|nr:hypothetical protein M0804_013382 [Polistes exclamans]